MQYSNLVHVCAEVKTFFVLVAITQFFCCRSPLLFLAHFTFATFRVAYIFFLAAVKHGDRESVQKRVWVSEWVVTSSQE